MATAKTTARPNPLLKRLLAVNACEEAREWVESNNIRSVSAAWEKCQNPDWMLWALNAAGIKVSDKKLRLFACSCIRETPLPDGRKVWDLLTDERSRRVVEVAERFANGEATQEELAAAWAAARDAARDAQAKILRKIIGKNPFKAKRRAK